MNWFNILKNLKGKSKATGSTLDASKIKVNIEDGPCKKRLKELRAKLSDAKPDSWKAKSLKRRIKKKGGEYSPAKMTVNITRPSYKMGGFGSK